ncbi:hypothetical protein UCRPC4_g05713 [Phaeomoniella chlamydospora]|uniref:J domain-containing protein n=1 Tax=Phaeomoniella chlamydospora TaxID=158046 RepID=A0A0G2E2M9_PHACM|nr:hypothetical protein UCRPC4_g05713 [Phaeomoniella chlamydospora]
MPRKQPSPTPSSSSEEEDLTSQPPTSIDPYTVLSLPRTATSSEITKAYRLSALRTHPDKAPTPSQKEEYTQRFQEVAFAYAILSDPARKRRYDTTGNTAESLELDDDSFDWPSYFKSKYEEVISGDAIERFKTEYQNTPDERIDILNAYTTSKGDMDYVFENVMCSEILVDEDRFRTIIQTAIDNNEVKAYKKFTHEGSKQRDRRRKQAESEAKEAEEFAHELGVADKLFGKNTKNGKSKTKKEDDQAGLMALIQQRQKSRQEQQNGFFDRLEEKYNSGSSKKSQSEPKSKPKTKKRSTPSDDEDGKDEGPSEEAFAAMQKRLEENKAKRKKV